MTNFLKKALPERKIPDWRAIQLSSRIPYKILQESRAYHINTNDTLIFQMLEYIGIDPICDMISQGCFMYDIATVLDIPPTKLREWLDSNASYLDKIDKAEQISAEAYLSISNNEIMNVHPGDTDAARVAKVKADHMKWLASRKDRNKYGDHVSHNHSGNSSVEYRISLVQPLQHHGNIIDIDP